MQTPGGGDDENRVRQAETPNEDLLAVVVIKVPEPREEFPAPFVKYLPSLIAVGFSDIWLIIEYVGIAAAAGINSIGDGLL